ncbi:DMT family transporter [Rhizobium sp. SEMIA 4085]|nr:MULTISPECIES: DMT family transporter [Rhizobium]NNH32959.1 DMT family transporter [Rhizobium sp. SEMIA 4085]
MGTFLYDAFLKIGMTGIDARFMKDAILASELSGHDATAFEDFPSTSSVPETDRLVLTGVCASSGTAGQSWSPLATRLSGTLSCATLPISRSSAPENTASQSLQRRVPTRRAASPISALVRPFVLQRINDAVHGLDITAVFVSEAFALSSALCFAMSSMLISELNGRVPLMRLARWQITSGLLITAALATVFGGWETLRAWQAWTLAISGTLGIALASTTYFATIYTAGPRLTALLFSLTSPFALLLGYLVLGETVTAIQLAGVALIVVGVVVAIGVRRRRPPTMIPLSDAEPIESIPPDAPPPWLLGISLGVVTALGQATGSLVARPAMASGAEPCAAMAVRSIPAALFFWALLMVPKIRRELTEFRKFDLGIAIAAALCGAALGMSLLMAALSTGNVGIVSTLSSMTPVVVLPLVWARTGQMPRPHAWVGAGLAIAGTALIGMG